MAFLPSWLNPFDVLIVFSIVAGVALGFVRGLVRMVLGLLVLYVAAVLALTLYETVGRWIGYMFGMARAANLAVAFILILVLVSVLLNFILRRTYKDTELPGVRQIDQLGGMVVGFAVTAIYIGLAILVISFVLNALAGDLTGLQQNAVYYFNNSNLIPIFYRFLPIAIASLKPWAPKGMPEILSIGGG
ncbi:MAG: CvpA family protein [Anaerolineae bacterium]|nr:CvpA family protein [Anaerolineae bacterium]